MKYANIARYVGSTAWAILPEKMDELLSVLAYRAAGHVFSAEEIQARIGDPQQPASSRQGAIAVIPLRGVIAHRMGTMDESSGGMSAERFTAMINAAVADPNVGSILIDVDSPGGTVPGVPEAADAVFAARDTKRVIAIANSTMASAAYWIASQAHEIVAIPSVFDRSIGSIGAFMVHQDLSAALEQAGVKVTLIKAGKHKADMNPFTPLSDELLAELQATVDAGYDAFVKAVARGRRTTQTAVRTGYGEGRAVSAQDALKAGLIDRIATFDETLSQMMGRKPLSSGLRALADTDPALAAAEGAIVEALAEELDAEMRQRLERF